ncbi:MAG: putative sugar nucleotidyl transferase [Chitinophagaceae bacterium]
MANIILVDHPIIREKLYPFSLTRPIGEFRIGITTLSQKWEHFLKGPVSFLTSDYLQEKYPAHLGADNYFIFSHCLPSSDLIDSILDLGPNESLYQDGEWIAYRGKSLKDRETSRQKPYLENLSQLTFPYQIFQLIDHFLREDFQILTKNRFSQPISATNQILGRENIFLEEGVYLECSVLNATQGPIYIGANAQIMEGCLIRGPFSLGNHGVLKMGTRIYGATSIGPHCVAGGEIKNSMFFGFSNKSHDGYIGDTVIGEWCNLGADTNSSNLRNNMGRVKIWNQHLGSYTDAGDKCGLIMGDYSRSGISSMFNTGTVVGVSCNIFGGDFPPKHIPSFSWGGASGWMQYQLDKAVADANAWKSLKGVKQSLMDEKILRSVFEFSHFSTKLTDV